MTSSYNKRATIADVSQIAKVSISTVSHVINGTRHVNEDTKQRVIKAIVRTGYSPNQIAKSLKVSNTRTIGLVISDFENPFFIDVISGIEFEVNRNGYSLLLADSNDDAEREFESVKNLYERRIDGLIFSPTALSEEKTSPYLKRIGIPTVLVDRKINIDCDWVGIENIQSTKELVNHLISLGHRHIALVTGLRGINTTEERIIGFKNALEEASLSFSEEDIIDGGSRVKPAEKNVHDYLINKKILPTALVVANNLMVLGTMRALKRMGISVPDGMALVSFDDFEWADLFQPRLTTMAQPCFDIGVKAVELLLNRIENPLSEYKNILFDPKLVIRESCGSKQILEEYK